MFKVVTNNPLAREWWRERESVNLHIHWQDGDLSDVLLAARDLVHIGWKLLNHPLSSSIKPNQTKFKTLVMQKGLELDLESLSVVEAAIATVIKLGSFPGGTERVLADLQLIDLELCKEIRLQ